METLGAARTSSMEASEQPSSLVLTFEIGVRSTVKDDQALPCGPNGTMRTSNAAS